MPWSRPGLLERRRYSERPPRDEYVPTARGRDFHPILVALLAWGNKHFAPEGASVLLVNSKTGAAVDPILVDRATGRPIKEPEYAFAPGPPPVSAPDEDMHRANRRDRAASTPACRRKPARCAQEDCEMSVAVLDRTLNVEARDVDVANVAVVELSPRTRVLLHGPIVPTLLRMAWPNVL